MKVFCKTYMALQGTEILTEPKRSIKSGAIKTRPEEPERIVINQYGRD